MKIAKALSFLFHPVLMPLLGLFIVFNSGIYGVEIPVQFKKYVYLITLLCDVLIPLTFIPIFVYLRQIQQISMEEKKERLVPLSLAMICFIIGYYLVAKFSPIKIINLFLLASSVITFLILIISIFWKISIHMAGIGGITALIGVISVTYKTDMTIVLSIAILLAGIIASARLSLKAHSPLQLLAGYAVGLFTVGGFLL